MKYFVNDGCISCGLCEGTCPEVFSMTDTGKAKAICFLQAFFGKSCKQKWRKLHLQNGESCRQSPLIVTEVPEIGFPSAWLRACQAACAAYPRLYRAPVFHGPLDSLAFLRSRPVPTAGS